MADFVPIPRESLEIKSNGSAADCRSDKANFDSDRSFKPLKNKRIHKKTDNKQGKDRLIIISSEAGRSFKSIKGKNKKDLEQFVVAKPRNINNDAISENSFGNPSFAKVGHSPDHEQQRG